MSVFQKPSDEPEQAISVKIYGAGGGGNHSPAQLGNSIAAAPALGGSVISGYNNVTIKPTTYDTVGINDHIIQGQMLIAEYAITTHEAQFMDDDHIKRLLLKEIVEKMYRGKYIEFTKQNDPASDTIKCRARIYVTPDTNVKLLRTYQK